MGWYGTHCATKSDLVAYLTQPETHDDGTVCRTLAKTVRGSTLWAVHERTSPNGETFRYIVAYISLGKSGGAWGYKPVSEDMGPCEVNCPVGYLSLAPEARGEYSAQWRARVLEASNGKKLAADLHRTAKVGDWFRLAPSYRSLKVRIVGRNGRNGRKVQGADVASGMVYTLSAKTFEGAERLPND